DFSGPHGWEYSATNLGRVDSVATAPCDGVTALQRRVLPMVEVRAEFAISRAELRDDDRGAADADLAALDRAAHQIAVAENRAVFHGWPDASISGIADASPHQGLQLGAEPSTYPRPVASAVELLLRNGIAGPYALALGNEEYKQVVETAEGGGYPLLEHLREIVVSMRGDDFLFESGQDLSIGYLDHTADEVRFYLEESFTFHVATPEAAVPIKAWLFGRPQCGLVEVAPAELRVM